MLFKRWCTLTINCYISVVYTQMYNATYMSKEHNSSHRWFTYPRSIVNVGKHAHYNHQRGATCSLRGRQNAELRDNLTSASDNYRLTKFTVFKVKISDNSTVIAVRDCIFNVVERLF